MTSRVTVDTSRSWPTHRVRRLRVQSRVLAVRLLSRISSSTISSQAIIRHPKDSRFSGKRWEIRHVELSSGRNISQLDRQYLFHPMVDMLCSLLRFETFRPRGQVIKNGLCSSFSLLIFPRVMSRRFGSI